MDKFEKIKGHFGIDQGAKLYDEIVSKLNNNSYIVELGCYLGKSTYYLIYKLKEKGIKFNLDVVDVFSNTLNTDPNSKYDTNFLNKFKDNMGEYLKDIDKIHETYTHNAVNNYDNESLDFIYVDASHSKEDVERDIKLWYPKLKKGGIIAGDDWQKPGVREAITNIILNNQKTECHPMDQKWSIYKYKSFELKYYNQWMITK